MPAWLRQDFLFISGYVGKAYLAQEKEKKAKKKAKSPPKKRAEH